MADERRAGVKGIAAVALLLLAAGWFASRINPPQAGPARAGEASAASGPARAGDASVRRDASTRLAPRGATVDAGPKAGDAAGADRPTAASAWTCNDSPRAASAPPLLAGEDAPASVRVALRRQIARLQASALPVDRAIAVIAEAGTRDLGLDPVAASPGREAWQEALARQALQAGDAQVYGMALRSCLSWRMGACAGLDAWHWAQAEPDNAVAWLYVGGDARRSSDAGALDEALYRMSVADRVDDGWNAALAALARTREPGDEGALALSLVGTRVIGRMAAWAQPLDVVTSACRPEAVASDANRRERCTAVARRFSERASTMHLSMFGDGVLSRLTGDDASRRHVAAFMRLVRQQTAAWDASDCAGARGMASYIERVAAVGERAAWAEQPAAGRDAPR
jgi:hypothetical protein